MNKIPIEIDEDIYKHLQSQAIPLKDDYSSVLRRLLITNNDTNKPEETNSKGYHPQTYYRDKILVAMHKLKGKAKPKQVDKEVYEMIKPELTPGDHDKTPGAKAIRWHTQLRWERNNMCKDGLLKPTEETGIGNWELSDKGIEEAKKSIK